MNEKKFVKDLTEEEQKEILNFIINKFEIQDKELMENFYLTMTLYIKNVRRSVETFERNVSEIIELFATCGYEEKQIIEMLLKEPSLLHADKNNIFWSLLILGKVYDSNHECIRDNYLVNNPRILRTSKEVMYARVKYLQSDIGKAYLRKSDILTARQITKITHEEFKQSYGISKENLLQMYKFDNDAQLDVISWPENKELLEFVYGRSV